ncbi:unnamed protein product [Vitrella brassicaformis CCMP3155]|uniref:Uncharacterized protein n=1 Tax=Vitrella brassicaformis (strain CCMP3155) TaxID=1169540 RepID=A0A0G4EHK9_VITBC|nr:unnamed protein product [Vitrella brassicaformis CCMP3155]|eukprot:CEL95505.1 unnamed protein product [Vitrella brassicaformis CCMP3155]
MPLWTSAKRLVWGEAAPFIPTARTLFLANKGECPLLINMTCLVEYPVVAPTLPPAREGSRRSSACSEMGGQHNVSFDVHFIHPGSGVLLQAPCVGAGGRQVGNGHGRVRAAAAALSVLRDGCRLAVLPNHPYRDHIPLVQSSAKPH